MGDCTRTTQCLKTSYQRAKSKSTPQEMTCGLWCTEGFMIFQNLQKNILVAMRCYLSGLVIRLRNQPRHLMILCMTPSYCSDGRVLQRRLGRSGSYSSRTNHKRGNCHVIFRSS